MFNMVNYPANRFFVYLVIILCLCSQLIHESVENSGYYRALDMHRHMADNGSLPDHLDNYDHEDDFASAEQVDTQVLAVSAFQLRLAHLAASSLSLSPLLPPPKAS